MAAINISSQAPLNAVAAAVEFLTRPLIPFHNVNYMDVRLVLRAAFQTCANASEDRSLVISISKSSPPPSPLFAACLASGIPWAQWYSALGNRDFDLVVTPDAVSAVYFSSPFQNLIVWTSMTHLPSQTRRVNLAPKERHIPISKLGQQARRPSAVRPPALTLAQELVEADKKEETEIFDLISKMAILSPSPVRDSFIPRLPTLYTPLPKLAASPLSSPELPASERSLSPTSTFSGFSDDESISTSATSARMSPDVCLNDDIIPDVPSDAELSPVYINKEKRDLTKYLYQGGQSTVLTGGVMLGNPKAAKPKSRPAFVPPQVRVQSAPTPKYRAPVGSSMGPRRFNSRPNHFPSRNSNSSATSNDWRRPAAIAPRF